ncbi:GntR family transcriptional regulator [Roseomonas sp. NAR14]|uniref:GntR family transcriptional regulator n=1 Tax=Roseomonas acroporae TaxID=2937791 RepID=A0A9X1Y7B4_9PROT|nr:GntR family transcriptional regulator [Roseomonas acroporae]MCK8784450.1 GntR family transcriptional regulator [Roseomonas acroporae]
MSNAAERAYQFIRLRILDGRFQPGEALREEMLAVEIGASRTPVRDALRRLLADGLVESARNYGTFVASIDNDEVMEVFELRAMLEGHAARKAAERIEPGELAELERLAASMEAIDGPEEATMDARIEEFARLNAQFHTVIARAARSRQLEALLGRVFQVPLIFLKRFRLHEWNNVARSNRHHREIIEALRERNADWAALAMSAHIVAVRPGAAMAAAPVEEAVRPGRGPSLRSA